MFAEIGLFDVNLPVISTDRSYRYAVRPIARRMSFAQLSWQPNRLRRSAYQALI